MKNRFLMVFLSFLSLTVSDANSTEKKTWDPDKLARIKLYGDPAFMHGDDISHIIPLTDGKRVMSSARDGSVRLWEIATGKELACFADDTPKDGVWNFKLLPGENEFIASYDAVVSRWDVKTGKIISRYPHTPEKEIFRLAISEDGKKFVAAGGDKQLVLWAFNNDKPLKIFKGHTSSVYTAIFSNNDLLLISGSSDKTIRFWDVATGAEKDILKKGFENIFTLKKSSDGKKMLICTDKRNIIEADTATGHEIWQGTLPDEVKNADWSPDGKFIAAVCDNKQLYLLDEKTGKVIYGVSLPGSTHWGIAFSRDGKQIFCGADNLLCTFEAKTGKRIFPAPEKQNFSTSDIKNMAVNEKLNKLFYAGNKTGIYVTNIKTGELMATWKPGKDIERILLSPDGKELLYTDDDADGRIFVLDAEDGKELRSFSANNSSLNCLKFTHDGKFLITGSSDNKIYIWDYQKKKIVKKLSGHTSSVINISISSDNTTLFSVSYDNSLRIWDLVSGKTLDTLNEGENSFNCCAVRSGNTPALLVNKRDKVSCWLLPDNSGIGMDQAKLKKMIKLLGADTFLEREQATQDLIKIGRPLLKTLQSVKTDDPEIKSRMEKVINEVARTQRILKNPFSEKYPGLNKIIFHPDEKHWIATTNSGLIIGEITDSSLKTIRTIQDKNNPDKIIFGESGNIYTGNKNGTISIYSTLP